MAKQHNNQVVEFDQDDSEEFDKATAIGHLHNGRKICHRYFQKHEYIKLDTKSKIVVDESGYEHGTIAEYFATLNKAFYDSWTIFKQPENE